MQEVPSSTENTHKQGTYLVPSKPLRLWLIIISILAVILFLVDAVLAFAIISTSVDHLKTGTRSISNGVSILYSVNDFHNDLEVEIPSILITIVLLGLGPIGGWGLRKRKPVLAIALSLFVLVSIITTFLLGLLLVLN
jgi:hypothetical protein